MVNKTQLLRRLLVLGCLLLLCVGLAGGQLLQLQLINGESYVRRSASFLTTTSTVSAARGEILDRYGRAMVTNQTGFSLVLIYSSFWEDKEDRFEVLLDLANRVKADGTAAAAANTDGGDETGDGTETDTDTKLAGKANSSHTHSKDQVGLGNVDNTADANKTVLEANRLKVRTTSSLVVTGGSGLYYYPANAQDLPPNNQDGLLLFITYGAWGGQLAFPTGGGVYYRYGTTTFSAWKRLDS